MKFYLYFILVTVLAVIYGFKSANFNKSGIVSIAEGKAALFDDTPPPQKVTSVPFPKMVIFAGDTVPLSRPDVKEGLERELMVNAFRHSNTIRLIKNLHRWKPLVSEILKENNIPEDFLYLAVIESEFDNNATSPAGAVGMWQIMEQTAKDYALPVNQDADMRRDPKLATIAAAKYLNWAYANLNNWTLAAASYNIGLKGIKDRLTSQKVNSFYDLYLNQETGRYIYRIIALKIILENPEKYGYDIPDTEKYHPYKFKTVTVTSSIENLVEFAKKNNTSYKQLRLLNPWFNNTTDFRLTVAANQSYEIRIPVTD